MTAFDKVRQVPFPDILSRFLPGAEPKRGKIRCPFHGERTPSFQIYPSNFFCFGCGAAGDGVKFVQLLENITALEAAQKIARTFGVAGGGRESTAERQAASARRREERAIKKFRAWEHETFIKLCRLRDKLEDELQAHGLDIPDERLDAVHKLPYIEHMAEILAAGSDEEKMGIYRNWRG